MQAPGFGPNGTVSSSAGHVGSRSSADWFGTDKATSSKVEGGEEEVAVDGHGESGLGSREDLENKDPTWAAIVDGLDKFRGEERKAEESKVGYAMETIGCM